MALLSMVRKKEAEGTLSEYRQEEHNDHFMIKISLARRTPITSGIGL